MSDSGEAAGSLITSIITDTHLEESPEIAPSTSADTKPVYVGEDDDLDSELSSIEVPDFPTFPDDKPSTLLNGQPIPDLRHEQTYLTAINRTNGSTSAILKVTIIDFILWPSILNFFYILGLNGFRALRTKSFYNGRKFGDSLRDFLNIGGVLD